MAVRSCPGALISGCDQALARPAAGAFWKKMDVVFDFIREIAIGFQAGQMSFSSALISHLRSLAFHSKRFLFINPPRARCSPQGLNGRAYIKVPSKSFLLLSLVVHHSNGTGRAARRAGWDSTASSAARRPSLAFNINLQAAARGLLEPLDPMPARSRPRPFFTV